MLITGICKKIAATYSTEFDKYFKDYRAADPKSVMGKLHRNFHEYLMCSLLLKKSKRESVACRSRLSCSSGAY